jgi:hypothetical protein
MGHGWVLSGMAIDGANAYWLDTYAKTVESASLAGGTIVSLVQNEPVALGPVVDATAVYWTTTAGQIRRIARIGPSACAASNGIGDGGSE